MTPADWALGAFVAVLIGQHADARLAGQQIPAGGASAVLLFNAGGDVLGRAADARDRASAGVAVSGLGLFGIYLALTSLAEVRQMWAFVFPRYIGSTEYVEFFGRGRGPLLNPAGSGILQGLCLLGMLMRWPRASRIGQLLILALLPLYCLGNLQHVYPQCLAGAGAGADGRAGLQSVARLADSRDRHAGRRLAADRGAELGTIDELQTRQGTKCGRSRRIGQAAPDLGGRRLAHVFGSALIGLGLWPISDRKPGLLIRSLDRLAFGESPALRAAQRRSWRCWSTRAWLEWGSSWRCWCFGCGWPGGCGAIREATPAARQFGLLFLAFVGVWFPNAMFQDVLMIPMANMLLALPGGAGRQSGARWSRARASATDRRAPGRAKQGRRRIMGPRHCKPEQRKSSSRSAFCRWDVFMAHDNS